MAYLKTVFISGLFLANASCSQLTSTNDDGSQSKKSRSGNEESRDGHTIAVSSALQSDNDEAKKVAKSVAADEEHQPQSNAKPENKYSDKDPGQRPAQNPYQNPGQTPVQMKDGDIEQEDIPGLTIAGLSYSGNACPEDSISSNISPDAKAFTLLFDSFYTETDPSASVFQAENSCSIQVRMLAPSGWQVALMTVDFRGFVDLAALDEAVVESRYQFSGSNFSDSFKAIIQGGQSNDFQARSDAFLKTSNWSNCESEKILNIDISTTVKSGEDTVASISLDALDGELSYKAGLMWRKCP